MLSLKTKIARNWSINYHIFYKNEGQELNDLSLLSEDEKKSCI